MNCWYAWARSVAAGSLSTGIPSARSPLSRPGESWDTTTRSGLYEAMASTFGLFPSSVVTGVPWG